MHHNPQQLYTFAYTASELRPELRMAADYCLDAPSILPCGGGIGTQDWAMREEVRAKSDEDDYEFF